ITNSRSPLLPIPTSFLPFSTVHCILNSLCPLLVQCLLLAVKLIAKLIYHSPPGTRSTRQVSLDKCLAPHVACFIRFHSLPRYLLAGQPRHFWHIPVVGNLDRVQPSDLSTEIVVRVRFLRTIGLTDGIWHRYQSILVSNPS